VLYATEYSAQNPIEHVAWAHSTTYKINVSYYKTVIAQNTCISSEGSSTKKIIMHPYLKTAQLSNREKHPTKHNPPKQSVIHL